MRNIESLSLNNLVIESVTPYDVQGNRVEQRRFIARMPVESGVYTAASGNPISLEVCPVDSKNMQKLILHGSDLPIKKPRGKSGQFKNNKPQDQLGRVVEFGYGPNDIQRQQVGANEHILFRLEARDIEELKDIFVATDRRDV